MPGGMVDSDSLGQLAGLLGPGGFLLPDDGLAGYEVGARYDVGKAAFVARPVSVADLSRVLAFCCRNEIALVPQSGNTGLVAGSTPDMSGRQGVLSLDRLREPFELDYDNRALRVGAGIRLSEINTRLREAGLLFPIDLGADPCAGGMVATNTGGARFLRFGDVRRNTLGLTVVLADDQGTVLTLGDGLRKDNAGPDWKQCFIGTSGAFGVIAECVFNVERLPVQTAAAYLVPRGDDDVMPLLHAMEDRLGFHLSAFEGMSGAAVGHALAHVPSLRNPFPGAAVPDYVLLAEVSRTWPRREGEQPLETLLEEVLAEIWEFSGQPLADAFVGRPEEMWALRHALSEGVKSAGRLVAFDISFRRGDVMRFRSHMRTELVRRFPQVELCDFGHVGDGGVHFNLVVPHAEAGATDELVETLREMVITAAVERFGGSFSAEHGLGRRNQLFYDRYEDPRLKRLAAAFKQASSPAPVGAVSLD